MLRSNGFNTAFIEWKLKISVLDIMIFLDSREFTSARGDKGCVWKLGGARVDKGCVRRSGGACGNKEASSEIRGACGNQGAPAEIRRSPRI